MSWGLRARTYLTSEWYQAAQRERGTPRTREKVKREARTARK